jgi:hypothetical protein
MATQPGGAPNIEISGLYYKRDTIVNHAKRSKITITKCMLNYKFVMIIALTLA